MVSLSNAIRRNFRPRQIIRVCRRFDSNSAFADIPLAPCDQKFREAFHVIVCDHLIAHTIAAMTVATNAMAMAMSTITSYPSSNL